MLEITNKLVEGIKEYFKSTNGKVAVIGISGGKDSSVTAALCVKALGRENVLGVLMPCGTQDDIDDSYKLCDFLDIEWITVDIFDAFYSIKNIIKYQANHTMKYDNISENAEINLQPRLRMSSLYAVAQSIDGGRVINTTNACEAFVGYGTLWGDTVGDFAPLANLTVSEVIIVGKNLNLPNELVVKTPSDGLCGKSDEEKLGVKYAEIENWVEDYRKFGEKHSYITMKDLMNKETFKRINDLHNKSKFKRDMIKIPKAEI